MSLGLSFIGPKRELDYVISKVLQYPAPQWLPTILLSLIHSLTMPKRVGMTLDFGLFFVTLSSGSLLWARSNALS